MKQEAAQSLAQWLQRNEPELFAALAQQAARAGDLAGITDVLSSIGSGIAKVAGSISTGVATAAKTVGGFLASSNGLSVLSSLGQTYLQSTAQKNALQVQLAAAQAGMAPAPIETRYDPATNSYVPIVGGTQLLTPQLTAQLLAQQRGSFDWQRWAPWLIGAGLLGGIVWLIVKRD
jgi:hypothetical protein